MKTNTPPAQADQSFEVFVTTWHAVRKHWLLAVGVALTVFLAVSFYTLGQKKIYQAVGTIQFDPRPPRPLGNEVQTVVDMGAGDYWNNREYYETQYHVISSNRTTVAVVEELGLQHDPAFIHNAAPNTTLPAEELEPLVAAKILRGRLSVDPVKDSRLARVKYEDADPQRAQLIVSTLLEVYTRQNLDSTLKSTNAAVEWLTTQMSKLKGDLETSELALHEYKQGNNILSVSLDDRSNMLREELIQLSKALTRAKTARTRASSRTRLMRKVRSNNPRNLPASELLSNPLLSSLRQRYEDSVRDRDALLGEGKGENHSDVKEAAARVQAAKEALTAEIINHKKASKGDLGAISQEVAGLSSLLKDAEKRAHKLNLLEIEYNRLDRARKNNEKLYAMLLDRTKETDLQRMLRVNNIHVLDEPEMPVAPIRPRVPLMLLLGAMAGFGLGIAAAVARGLADRTIKTPDDAEQDLGVPCLGALPVFDAPGAQDPNYGGRKRKRGRRLKVVTRAEMMVHEAPTSAMAEAARAVRTNLMFMSPDKPFETMLISSARPGEGKTTMACCIATAIAQAGKSVLLIDCDLRRPKVHRIFNKSSSSGLSTALIDETVVSDELIKTEIPNLNVLPAGPIPPNPAELFHSERFKKLLAHFNERFDRVIIDSSPLLAVTDAAILSTLVDATVLVVRSGQTRKDVAQRALRSVLDLGSNVAGVVVNGLDYGRHDYKYSYYGYGPKMDDDSPISKTEKRDHQEDAVA